MVQHYQELHYLIISHCFNYAFSLILLALETARYLLPFFNCLLFSGRPIKVQKKSSPKTPNILRSTAIALFIKTTTCQTNTITKSKTSNLLGGLSSMVYRFINGLWHYVSEHSYIAKLHGQSNNTTNYMEINVVLIIIGWIISNSRY